MDTAEVSYDGWPWTTSARAPDVVEHQYPVAYAYRGLSLDSEGTNRNVNVAIPTVAGRMAADPFTPDDPDVLPGQTDVAAPDGPDNEVNTGYLWDAALRAKSHGSQLWFLHRRDAAIPRPPAPFPSCATRPQPARWWPIPANATLAPFTDPYFRGFDNALPGLLPFQGVGAGVRCARLRGG